MHETKKLNWFLKLRITIDDVGIHMDQSNYVKQIIEKYDEKFSLKTRKPRDTPHDYNVTLDKDGRVSNKDTAEKSPILTAKNKTLYREIIGELLHLVKYTRMDLMPSTHTASRFNNLPTQKHLRSLVNTLTYVKTHPNIPLTFYWGDDPTLITYSDSDFATCRDTRRSISSHIIFSGKTPIYWYCKRQRTPAYSTCEAEYMAMADLTRSIIYFRQLYTELGYEQKPTIMYVDNQPAIAVSKEPRCYKRTKHIAICYHITRNQVVRGNITPVYIASELNLADFLTEPMSVKVFQRLLKTIYA